MTTEPSNSQPDRLEDKLSEVRKASRERMPGLYPLTERLAAELEDSVIREAISVGDRAPDFELPVTGSERTMRLSDAISRGPVVLSFYRGEWCPYCRLELQGLQQALPRIEALGAEIYFIGPLTEEKSIEMMEQNHASIPILYDLDGTVMEAYRIAFEIPDYLKLGYQTRGFPDANPGTGWRLPVPATYVIDGGGLVRARYANGDYTRRMEPADILAALEEIVGVEETSVQLKV